MKSFRGRLNSLMQELDPKRTIKEVPKMKSPKKVMEVAKDDQEEEVMNLNTSTLKANKNLLNLRDSLNERRNTESRKIIEDKKFNINSNPYSYSFQRLKRKITSYTEQYSKTNFVEVIKEPKRQFSPRRSPNTSFVDAEDFANSLSPRRQKSPTRSNPADFYNERTSFMNNNSNLNSYRPSSYNYTTGYGYYRPSNTLTFSTNFYNTRSQNNYYQSPSRNAPSSPQRSFELSPSKRSSSPFDDRYNSSRYFPSNTFYPFMDRHTAPKRYYFTNLSSIEGTLYTGKRKYQKKDSRKEIDPISEAEKKIIDADNEIKEFKSFVRKPKVEKCISPKRKFKVKPL